MVHAVTIPTRFLTTIGHLIAVIMIIYSQDANVMSSMSSTYTAADYTSTNSSLTASVWLSIVCLAAELISIFIGFTLFNTSLNVLYSLVHFVGTVLTAWFVLDAWGALSNWFLFGFFCFLPAAIEFLFVARIMCCKVGKF